MSHPLVRAQQGPIVEDLATKMVLLAGPRQCGKTSLAKGLVRADGGAYYNWDIDADRKRLKSSAIDAGAQLWVFDELHKFRQWRNWLKGQYDAHHADHRILVTGSARLDLYHRRGDSLAGRYFLHHLHPLTLGELGGRNLPADVASLFSAIHASSSSHAPPTALHQLLAHGGFPEPFLAASPRFTSRWQMALQRAIVREDIGTLEAIRDLDKVETLFERAPDLVGSPLSINALREDLEVAFETVKAWVGALERVYAVHRIPPFGTAKIKAVRKEQKMYMWDWARVPLPGPRLENLVAGHLLRLVHWAEDVWGEKLELRYFRSKVGHEVDFILLKKRQPLAAIEVKSSFEPVDRGLNYFLERVKTPHAFQLHGAGSEDTERVLSTGQRVRQMSVTQFLAQLP